MNFLAHLALSHYSADLQVGNFIGDLLRGRGEVDTLPEGIRRGVELHRRIDRFTDADPDVRRLNARLRSAHGRYAGVISDVAFDHFLFLNWEALGPAPFPAFTQQAYDRLHAARPLLPRRLVPHVDGLTRHQWLSVYTSEEGMADVFRRMLPRLSRPELLRGVNQSLQEHHDAFNRTLLLLFPRLQALARTYRD
ncbi:acyl carrier protein phosphodiesterase [Lewinella marina]|uniref:ACP phosphodiesterase n=1 Tax=Neolewinella marina TaxID=438751 RepID=A0A2G0CG01_9BACT|nr:ACP phosphodiesterase [Neolewinella marina]NJB85567.1 acyl carrier protein phosphodiesterase [Neolewinella marina]PHK98915.1 hypothetical protein CGL56_09795 [Neolewinella marina]